MRRIELGVNEMRERIFFPFVGIKVEGWTNYPLLQGCTRRLRRSRWSNDCSKMDRGHIDDVERHNRREGTEERETVENSSVWRALVWNGLGW